jgi:hypothetical protein
MSTDLSAVGLMLLSISAMHFVVLRLDRWDAGWDYFREAGC